jgi:hypothetical protein
VVREDLLGLSEQLEELSLRHISSDVITKTVQKLIEQRFQHANAAIHGRPPPAPSYTSSPFPSSLRFRFPPSLPLSPPASSASPASPVGRGTGG